MLSSSKFIRPRSLHRPNAWALSPTSGSSLIMLHSSSNVQTIHPLSNPKIPSRRSFSWGRRRQWGYSDSPGLYRLFESRSRASKGGRCTSLHHNYFPERCHSIYRYLSGHGWRLSNSWGGSDYGRGNFSRPSESGKFNDVRYHWSKSFQEKQAAIEKDFEDFKKMVDADPYGMLFGWRTSHLKRRSADKGENENPNHKRGSSGLKSGQRDDKTASTAKPVENGQFHEHTPETSPPIPEVKASLRQTEIEEYEFDPITMRKVPKRPTRPTSAPIQKRTVPNSEFDIPVKPFVATGTSSVGRLAHPEAPPRNEVHRPKQPGRNWLAQEGFGASSPGLETLGSQPQQQSEHIRSAYSKIETALDRHRRTMRAQAEESSTNHPPLKSKDEESTTEDIELLRASDIRASAGLAGRSPKETDKEKLERRKSLENDYEKRPQYLDARFKAEVAYRNAQAAKSPFHEKRSPNFSHPGHSGLSLANSVGKSSDREPSTLSNVVSKQRSEQLAELSRSEAFNRKMAAAKSVHEEKLNALYEETNRKLEAAKSAHEEQVAAHEEKMAALRETINRKTAAAKSVLQEEIKTQKVAMEAFEMRRGSAEKRDRISPVHFQESGEGDMASNVSEFVGRGRWYKQRAPHAMKESELKLQQMAKDRAFVQEIRSIYEDEYGTIDTQHRQPSRQAEREDKEHIREATDQSSKQPSREVEQKDKEQHEQLALDQLSEQSSSRALPYRVARVSLDAQNSLASKFDSNDFRPRQLQRQVEQKDKEHAQEATNQSKESSPRALRDMPDTSLSPNKSAKPQHVENRELERPGVSRAIPEFINDSDVELPASTDKETRNFDAPTIVASMTSDESGSSSTSKPISSEASDSIKPSSYRILAYDPSTQRVSSAKTTSMTAHVDEKTLSLVEALSRLATPAKFLPHFASLQNSGYEIVSGSTNVLIFKKVRPAKPASHVAEDSSPTTIDDKYPRHTNPIDGTTTQTGNFASPTGFVNHDAILPPSEDGEPMAPYPWSTKPNDKVTRQEEVFSGSRSRCEDHRAERMNRRLRNKQRRAERRKRTLKRMVWVGIWVAGCCYVVGVGTEFLRA